MRAIRLRKVGDLLVTEREVHRRDGGVDVMQLRLPSSCAAAARIAKPHAAEADARDAQPPLCIDEMCRDTCRDQDAHNFMEDTRQLGEGEQGEEACEQ